MGKTHSYGSHMRLSLFYQKQTLYDKTISFCGPTDSCSLPFQCC